MKIQISMILNAVAVGMTAFGIAGCSSKSSDSNPAVIAAANITGNYEAACASLGGTVYTATHAIRDLSFSGNTFSSTELFFSDAACTAEVYAMAMNGTFVIGSATTSPSGGYNITFSPTSSSLTSYTTGASTAINSPCSLALSTSTVPSTVLTSSGLSCGGGTLGFVASGTTLYNVFAVSGTTLGIGTTTQNNPGVSVSSSVSTSVSTNFTKY